MRQLKNIINVFGAILVSLTVNTSSAAQQMGDSYTYVRIFNDKHGVSHFEEVSVNFQITNFAPPAAPLGVSGSLETGSLFFISASTGWDGGWHPTPRKSFAVLLSGTERVTVGDSDVRIFGPGDVVLLEDTMGKGHLSEITSSTGVIVLMIPVASE